MGVSQRVAGLGTDPTYNNLSEALNDFWERRIVPDRNADAATLNRQWLPLWHLDDGKWRFRFDYSQVPALQENRDALHARVRADWEKGLVDKQQARAMLGYGTSNDGAFERVFYGEKAKTESGAPEGELSQSQLAQVKALLWEESQHPRDEKGRFAGGSTNAVVSHNAERRVQILYSELEPTSTHPFNHLSSQVFADQVGSANNSASGNSKRVSVINQAKGDRKAAVEATIEEINRIHRVDNLPRLPLIVEVLRGMHGALNTRSTKNGLEPQGISIDRGCQHVEMTTAHEIGHLIDLVALGEPYRFASHGKNEIMEDFKTAVAESNAIKNLRIYQEGNAPDATDKKLNSPLEKHLVSYWLQEHEIWARAYAQYIATKGGNENLKAQLKDVQNKSSFQRERQWSEEDFVPIGRAIDAMFKKQGWI
jgi:hypothetical protein